MTHSGLRGGPAGLSNLLEEWRMPLLIVPQNVVFQGAVAPGYPICSCGCEQHAPPNRSKITWAFRLAIPKARHALNVFQAIQHFVPPFSKGLMPL